MENPESAPPENSAPQSGTPDPWEQPGAETAPATEGTEPAATPAPSKKRRRACCLGCLGLVLLPLLILLIWFNSGPAPAPADCLPVDYPVRWTLRDPAGLVEDYAEGPRWRSLLVDFAQASGDKEKLPSRKEAGDIAFWIRHVVGSEVAGAINEEGRNVIAVRCGFLGRAFGKISRFMTDADGVGHFKKDNNYFAFIGNTMLMSPDRDKLMAILARREEILAGKASAAPPPAEARVTVRFKDFKLPAEKADDQAARGIAFILDVPGLEGLTGELRADRALEKLSGALTFDGRKTSAPPALPPGGPKSAKLAPAGALGYWVWHAPAGAGRWSPAGRIREFEAIEQAGKEEGAEPKADDGGGDAVRLLAKELVGERGIFITSQPIPGDQALQVAATVFMEARDVKTAWPACVKLVSSATGLRLSADGRPPTYDGKPIYPHLVKRRYRDREYLEMVYAFYPQGSGYRPAFGTVGNFLVATSSRMELERMLDRAAGASAKTMADEPGMLPAAGAARPAALLVFRPGNKGGDLADLALLIKRIFSPPEEQPGKQAERSADAVGRLLDRIKSLRAEWVPRKDGSLKLTVEGELVP